jgi:hypothetical protein
MRGGCFPHNFIRVNGIFEVGGANGFVAAYTDKHPHEFWNGPSGVGLSQDTSRRLQVDCTVEAQEAWDDLRCLYPLRIDHRIPILIFPSGPPSATGHLGTGQWN